MRKLTRAVRWAAPAGALVLCLPAALVAQEEGAPPAQAPQERVHEVKRDDTLWDLAQHYYNNPFHWPIIYEANRDVVEDPHWIYPAERIVIPGLPLARTQPAQPRDTAVVLGEPEPDPEPLPARRPTQRLVRTRFYTAPPESEAPTILETLGPTAVQAGEFYAAPWTGSAGDLPVIAEMLRVSDPDVATMGGVRPTARPFDQIYLGYHRGAQVPQVGDKLLLVTIGRRMRGGLGRLITPAAIITVRTVDAEVLTAVVGEQFGPVERGALAIPLERFSMLPGESARPVADGGDGIILDFADEQALYATTDHAFVNIGSAHGLRIGDELIAYVAPRRGEGGRTLPPEPVARMRIVRVQDETATALITKTAHGVLDRAMPVRVMAEMP